MNRNYLTGVLLTFLMFAIGLLLYARFVPVEQTVAGALRFEPEFLGLSDDTLISPGRNRRIQFVLHNVSDQEVSLERVRCPLNAVVSIPDLEVLPIDIAPSGRLSVEIVITAGSGLIGIQELKFVAEGRSNGRNVNCVGVAECRFAQAINASPMLVHFGQVRPEQGKQASTVKIWVPREDAPPATLSVSTTAPWIEARQASLDRAAEIDIPGGTVVAAIRISLDPARAPDSVSDAVLVTAGDETYGIPVLAFVSNNQTSSNGAQHE